MRLDVAIVDEAEVHDVHRNLRVVAGLHLRPGFLLDLFQGARRVAGTGGLLFNLKAERVRVLSADAEHVPVHDDSVSTAERLRDVRGLTLEQRDLGADGHDRGFDIAGESDGFVGWHSS